MKYRDPKTGNLELFPILNTDNYIEKILKECNTALESKNVAPVENLDKLAEAINEIIPYTPPALLNLKEDISFTLIQPTPVNITEKFVPIITGIILS